MYKSKWFTRIFTPAKTAIDQNNNYILKWLCEVFGPTYCELQEKFNNLEKEGVFLKPEDIGVAVEYLNPSFLVKKPSGGHWLFTAFEDVGRYSKPQPSLMPDVDSTLRTIAPWKLLIKSDLSRAFYQIPLSRASRKYCGVATSFRGIRVYCRSAMGMPGSETALEVTRGSLSLYSWYAWDRGQILNMAVTGPNR